MSPERALRRTLRNWQLMSFLLVISLTVVTAAYVERSASSRLVPYLVEVSPQGQTTFAGPIEAVDLPEERLVLHQIRAFVWDLRLVVNDPAAQAELVARAYALADEPVRRKLDRHFNEPGNDPRLLAAKASRAVEQITVLPMPGADLTYQVQWTEALTYRTAYAPREERSFSGLITVDLARRLPPEALAYNPLPLVVTEFTWTEIPSESP